MGEPLGAEGAGQQHRPEREREGAVGAGRIGPPGDHLNGPGGEEARQGDPHEHPALPPLGREGAGDPQAVDGAVAHEGEDRGAHEVEDQPEGARAQHDAEGMAEQGQREGEETQESPGVPGRQGAERPFEPRQTAVQQGRRQRREERRAEGQRHHGGQLAGPDRPAGQRAREVEGEPPLAEVAGDDRAAQEDGEHGAQDQGEQERQAVPHLDGALLREPRQPDRRQRHEPQPERHDRDQPALEDLPSEDRDGPSHRLPSSVGLVRAMKISSRVSAVTSGPSSAGRCSSA